MYGEFTINVWGIPIIKIGFSLISDKEMRFYCNFDITLIVMNKLIMKHQRIQQSVS